MVVLLCHFLRAFVVIIVRTSYSEDRISCLLTCSTHSHVRLGILNLFQNWNMDFSPYIGNVCFVLSASIRKRGNPGLFFDISIKCLKSLETLAFEKFLTIILFWNEKKGRYLVFAVLRWERAACWGLKTKINPPRRGTSRWPWAATTLQISCFIPFHILWPVGGIKCHKSRKRAVWGRLQRRCW